MTFAVNPEKKRTWNHGWWRDWAQGKVLIVSVARHSSVPLRQTSAESLAIEDGWLTFSRHVTADADPKGMRVTAARLADCSFWWDRKRRQLVIDAERPEAIVGWHTDLAHLNERPSAYERADCLRLYPFYDPDPVTCLREIGVRERVPRSARWEM